MMTGHVHLAASHLDNHTLTTISPNIRKRILPDVPKVRKPELNHRFPIFYRTIRWSQKLKCMIAKTLLSNNEDPKFPRTTLRVDRAYQFLLSLVHPSRISSLRATLSFKPVLLNRTWILGGSLLCTSYKRDSRDLEIDFDFEWNGLGKSTYMWLRRQKWLWNQLEIVRTIRTS